MTYTEESVTIHHITTGTKDKYGDLSASTTTDTTLTAKVAPGTSVEGEGRAEDGVADFWTLYLPAGTTVAYTDTVTVRGVECRVDGDPAEWHAGTVVKCVRA
jgi:hypothetical protein